MGEALIHLDKEYNDFTSCQDETDVFDDPLIPFVSGSIDHFGYKVYLILECYSSILERMSDEELNKDIPLDESMAGMSGGATPVQAFSNREGISFPYDIDIVF
jgi:hypothetical protein